MVQTARNVPSFHHEINVSLCSTIQKTYASWEKEVASIKFLHSKNIFD